MSDRAAEVSVMSNESGAYIRWLGIILALLVFLHGRPAIPNDAPPSPLQPNARLQVAISQSVDAFAAIERDHAGSEVALRSLDEMTTRFKDKQGQIDYPELVRQLLHFQWNASKQRNEVAFGSVLLMWRFLAIPDFAIVEGLAPNVDVKDESLSSLIRNQFDWIDGAKPLGVGRELRCPDYSVYYRYIYTFINDEQNRVTSIPAPFVAYIFEKAPREAVLTFVRAHKDRWPGEQRSKVRAAVQTVDNAVWWKANGFDEQFDKFRQDAIDALTGLVEYREFWIRLYVAEILDDCRDLCTAAIRDKLTKEEHPLVRRAMSKISEKSPP